MLKRELLRLLLRGDPYPLPESTLLAEARLAGPRGETEMADALQFLERSHLAVCLLDDLTQDRLWRLTPAGRQKAVQSV